MKLKKIISTSDNNRGCLEACKGCSGFNCCGSLCKGGKIEPPFLTKHDLSAIKYFTGMKIEDFSETRINPYTGKSVFFLKTNKKQCFFFNPDEGKCKIHAIRPVDCRLFPLDIKKINSHYFWILYSYEHCNLTDEDIPCLLNFRDRAVSILGGELIEYATVPLPGMAKLPQQILGEVRL